MEEQKSEITREYEFLKVDGRYFEMRPEKETVSYIEVPKKRVEEKIKIMKQICNKMKNNLDKEAILMEALSKLDITELKKFYEALYKKKIKPKTRQHHCVDMKVGNLTLPIID